MKDNRRLKSKQGVLHLIHEGKARMEINESVLY